MSAYDYKKDLQKIIEKYVSGKATPEEIEFIEDYYQYLDKGENVLDQLKENELQQLGETGYDAIKAKIAVADQKLGIYPIYRYVAAAVIVAVFGTGIFYATLRKEKKSSLPEITKTKRVDILPGVDKAILTLADGSKVVLDSKSNENIVENTSLTISKTKSGQLIYKVGDIMPKNNANVFNTIETSKGNQYQVILPDGTRVWLNAASSLRYPEVFAANERKVFLTGEAYFEVASLNLKEGTGKVPFVVHTVSDHGNGKGQDVEVLGTHFNINSYMDDQSIKTTLLEGRVKVSNERFSKVLNPGEQAIVQNYGLGTINITRNVETDDEIAWKNGLFRFNNAGLKSILSQLERWYDVKIDYRSVPDKRYNGMVPRNAKLSEVLNMLELTGNIDFSIEENRELKVLAK